MHTNRPIHFRLARNEEFTHLVELMNLGFTDGTEEFNRLFVGNTRLRMRSYVAIGPHELPIACFFALPGDEQSNRYVYLYALTTHPQWQGKGIAKQLVNHIIQKETTIGTHGLILVPATESLFTYYERLGFKPFSRRTTHLSIQKNTVPYSAKLTLIEWDQYTAERHKRLKSVDAFHWDNSFFLFWSQTNDNPIKAYRIELHEENAIAIIETIGTKKIIHELLPQVYSTYTILQWIQSASDAFASDETTLYLCSQTDPPVGETTNYSMIYQIAQTPSPHNSPYFMLSLA